MPQTASYLSVVHYQPGHAGLKAMVQKTVSAYKKHDPNRHFFIYKPVDGKEGVAYCLVNEGKFGLLKKELGDKSQAVLQSGNEGITSKKTYQTTTVRHMKGFDIGAPYLAVIKVTYDPANANKIREIAKRSDAHAGTAKKYSIFTVKDQSNTFYIAFGLDNIEVLDKQGGLMSYVKDPEVKALYEEFKHSVKTMKLIKLRLLPEFSNC
jgi:hypothetical protein